MRRRAARRLLSGLALGLPAAALLLQAAAATAQGGTASPRPAAPAAGAKSGQFGNSDQPIAINADSLEVLQNNQVAIFRGNVEAVQGEIRLRAAELRVYYQQEAKPAAGKPAPGAPGGSNIVRIDALGQVFVASPGETAQGDVGVYDVPRHTITLNGNVVLTRGPNVLRGNQLVMDMDSGRSQVSGGRVRALIDPKGQK